jgi:hypothetical protein
MLVTVTGTVQTTLSTLSVVMRHNSVCIEDPDSIPLIPHYRIVLNGSSLYFGCMDVSVLPNNDVGNDIFISSESEESG